MWDSGGDNEDDGSGDYDNYDDNETSSVQFSFTNVENNRSEESVIELPGIFMIIVDPDSGLTFAEQFFVDSEVLEYSFSCKICCGKQCTIHFDSVIKAYCVKYRGERAMWSGQKFNCDLSTMFLVRSLSYSTNIFHS